MDSNNGSTPNGEDGAGTVIKKEDTQDENMTIKPDPEIAPEISDLSIEAVLAFLKKKGLSGTEDKLKQELSNPSTNQNSQNPELGNSQDTTASSVQSGIVKTEGSSADVSNVLDSYKSEGDPSIYADAYKDLQRFVEASLDLYRHELALILYPVFVHMYLELVYNGHENEAKKYVAEFGPKQEPFYQDDIKKLSYITKREHKRQ